MRYNPLLIPALLRVRIATTQRLDHQGLERRQDLLQGQRLIANAGVADAFRCLAWCRLEGFLTFPGEAVETYDPAT